MYASEAMVKKMFLLETPALNESALALSRAGSVASQAAVLRRIILEEEPGQEWLLELCLSATTHRAPRGLRELALEAAATKYSLHDVSRLLMEGTMADGRCIAMAYELAARNATFKRELAACDVESALARSIASSKTGRAARRAALDVAAVHLPDSALLREAAANFLLSENVFFDDEELVALAARLLCGTSFVLDKKDPLARVLSKGNGAIVAQVIRSIFAAMKEESLSSPDLFETLLSIARSPSAPGRRRAHLALAVWCSKTGSNCERVLEVALWQLNQGSPRRDLVAAAKVSFEAAVEGLGKRAAHCAVMENVEGHRARCLVFDVLLRRSSSLIDEDLVWDSVDAGLAATDSGAQRSAAALAARVVTTNSKSGHLSDRSARGLVDAWTLPATKAAAADRLAPLLRNISAELLNAAIDRATPNHHRDRLRAKLAAFQNRPNNFVKASDLERAFDDGDVDLRVAALTAAADRSDSHEVFVTALRLALTVDASIFPRPALTSACRRVAKKCAGRCATLAGKTSTSSRAALMTLKQVCDIALESLCVVAPPKNALSPNDDNDDPIEEATDSLSTLDEEDSKKFNFSTSSAPLATRLQLTAAEVLAAVASTLGEKKLPIRTWLDPHKARHALVSALMFSTWDRVRDVAYEVLVLCQRDTDMLDEETATAAMVALAPGPAWHQRNVARVRKKSFIEFFFFSHASSKLKTQVIPRPSSLRSCSSKRGKLLEGRRSRRRLRRTKLQLRSSRPLRHGASRSGRRGPPSPKQSSTTPRTPRQRSWFSLCWPTHRGASLSRSPGALCLG